jgi:uncharacterized protein
MKKNGLGSLLILILSFTVFLSYPQGLGAQNSKTFLWKIEHQGPVVYVLGSIHILKKEHYPLSPRIENAFDEADTLVVEADINKKMNPMNLILTLKEKAFYEEGDNLQNHVSGETYAQIKKEAARMGLPPEMVDRLRPWVLGFSTSSLEIMKSGYDPKYGVDYYFLTKAVRQKRVLELEGIDYQLNLLSSFSDAEQELLLRRSLQGPKTSAQALDAIVKAWKAGDAAGVEAMVVERMQEDKELAFFYEKLLPERNKKMVDHIEFYLKTNGTYYVVVGAAHLVGKKGIIRILQEKGYRVRQL